MTTLDVTAAAVLPVTPADRLHGEAVGVSLPVACDGCGETDTCACPVHCSRCDQDDCWCDCEFCQPIRAAVRSIQLAGMAAVQAIPRDVRCEACGEPGQSDYNGPLTNSVLCRGCATEIAYDLDAISREACPDSAKSLGLK